MFWNVVLFIVMWAVGAVLYLFGMLQVLISFFTSLPMTKHILQHCRADKKSMYKSICFTIVLWTIICSGVIASVLVFGNSYAKSGFFVGIGMCFVLSGRRFGPSQNFDEYLITYGKYINLEDLENYTTELTGVSL